MRDWWTQRALFPAAGIVLTVAACFYAVRGGIHGFYTVFEIMAGVLILTLGIARPVVAPFVIVALAVWDKNVSLAGMQVTTLQLGLLLLTPAFLISAARVTRIPRTFRVGAVLLTLGLFIAAMTAMDKPSAFLGAATWVLVLVMVAGTIALIGQEPTLLRRLGVTMLIGGTVSGVFAELQRRGVYVLVGPPYASDVVNSTFGYYTNFASFEAVVAVIGLGLLYQPTSRRMWVCIAVCTAIVVYSTIASLSRGAVISLVVGALILVLRSLRRPRRAIGVGIVATIVGGLAWMFLPGTIISSIVGRFTVTPTGDVVRQELQAGGAELLRSQPLGIGFGNFANYVNSGMIAAQQALAHSHNLYIQMGLDAGWIGLVGFALLLLLPVLATFTAQGIRLAYCAALVGFLAQCTQDFFFFEPASLVIFGVVLACAMAPARASIEAQSRVELVTPGRYAATEAPGR